MILCLNTGVLDLILVIYFICMCVQVQVLDNPGQAMDACSFSVKGNGRILRMID